MSPILISLAVLLLCAAAMAPFLWMAARPASAKWLAPTAGAVILALAFVQTGALQSGSLASPDVTHLLGAETPESRCRKVFDLLADNGVLLEEPGPEGLVVRGAAWDRLPAPVTEAIIACVQADGGDTTQDVDVIRR